MVTVEQMLERLYQCCCVNNKLLAKLYNKQQSMDDTCEQSLRSAFTASRHRLSQFSGGGTPWELMKEDPTRTGFVVANGSTGLLGISLSNTAAIGNTIRVDTNERTFSMWYSDGGALVQHPWFAVSNAGGAFGILLEHFCGMPGTKGDGVSVIICP